MVTVTSLQPPPARSISARPADSNSISSSSIDWASVELKRGFRRLRKEPHILYRRKRLWHLLSCAIKCRRPQLQTVLEFMTGLLGLEENLTVSSSPFCKVLPFICSDWCCLACTWSPAVPVHPSVYTATANEDATFEQKNSPTSVADRIDRRRIQCG